MKLTEIILDNFAPQNLRALWLQPKPNKTVAFKVFNNGVWMDTFEWQDLSGFLTREDAAATYQPIGDYALRSEIPSLAGYVTDESLAQTLLSYVTSDSLSSTLSDYLTLEDAQLGYQPKGDYALNSALTGGLAAKADNFTVGTGLEMTPGRVLNVTLDTTVFKVVSALPDTPDAGDENKVFLVSAESTGPNNAYTEYLWINSAWEEFGQYVSDVDLTPYLKSADAANTYLSKTNAQSTYLSKTDAANTYQPKGEYQPAGDYALKSELPSYTTVPELTADYTVPANATTREFIYEIPVGATVYNITGASGIKWAGGTAPAVQANKTYLIRVIHNLATWTEF